jgi:hypothetical protein
MFSWSKKRVLNLTYFHLKIFKQKMTNVVFLPRTHWICFLDPKNVVDKTSMLTSLIR